MTTDQQVRSSHIDFINEILRRTDARDSMNDYWPNRIWIDTDTGTYGSCEGLVILDTTDWSSEDDDAWEDMTDSERNDYGKLVREHKAMTTPGYVLPTPSEVAE